MNRRLLLAVFAAALTAGPALAAGKPEKKKAGGESFLQIAPVLGTIQRPGGRRGVLTVEVGVDVPNGALRDHAWKVMPRLRAAYVQAVQIYAAGLSPGTPPNADFLARSLQRETDLVLGKPGARLLLGAVIVG